MANVISEYLSQEVASDIKVLLRDLKKLLKVLTIYPDDNPLPIKMRQSFGSRFTELVEEYSGFVFMIRPDEIVYNREIVYQDQGQEDTLAAFFYNAGIIQLQFREGLGFQEFIAFIDLLRTYLNDRSQDRDLVAMMWQEQFSHIKFKTVEDLALNEYQTEMMIREMYSGFGNFENSLFDIERVVRDDLSGAESGSSLGTLSNLPEVIEDGRQMGLDLDTEAGGTQQAFAQLFSSSSPPAAEERREIERLLEAGRDFDPYRTATRIIVEIMHFWDDPELFAETVAISQRILDRLLIKGDFITAAGLIHSLRGLKQELEGSKPVHAEHLKNLIAAAGDNASIRKLTDIINRQEIVDRRAVEIFLDSLGWDSLAPITGMLGQLVSKEARLTVCDYLARRGKECIDILAKGLHDRRWYVVRNTIMILGRIGGAEIMPYLSEAARHPDRRVRQEIITALGGKDSDAAIDLIFGFLRDPEIALRRKALNYLKKTGGQRSFEIIRTLIHSPEFPTYSLEEQEQFLIVYSSLGDSEAADFLGSMVKSFTFFNFGWKARYRIMALKALAYNPSIEAEKLILKYAGSHRAWLRQAAVAALDQRRRLIYTEEVDR